MGYIIGSLNARNFSGLDTHNINKIAEMIRAEEFDIIALQEVRHQRAINFLLQRLVGWEGYYGKSQSDSDYGKGRDGDYGGLGFAYLWNVKRMRECSKNMQPKIIDRFSSTITRKPLYGIFTPSGLGGPSFEIRLINVHLWFGGSYDGGFRRRINEFELVTDEIYNYYSNHRYGDFMPALTIILGDYNLRIEDTLKYFIKTIQDEKTTICTTRACYVSDYDHFSYDEKRFSATKILPSRVDSVSKYLNNDFEKHWYEISDHVPIKIELILN